MYVHGDASVFPADLLRSLGPTGALCQICFQKCKYVERKLARRPKRPNNAMGVTRDLIFRRIARLENSRRKTGLPKFKSLAGKQKLRFVERYSNSLTSCSSTIFPVNRSHHGGMMMNGRKQPSATNFTYKSAL